MFYREHKRVPKTFKGVSRAKQEFKKECDINSIMAKYRNSGVVSHLNRYEGRYGDFSSATDYQTSLNQVMAAQAAFDSLPSAIRRRFGNDPASFLAFVQDPGNEAELVEMGLARKRPVEAAKGAPSEDRGSPPSPTAPASGGAPEPK